jgi:HSP20 family protein
METKDIARPEPQRLLYRTPAVEVFEDDQSLWVSADLPGVAAADLEVTVDDGVLSVLGRIGGSDDAPVRHAFRRQFTLTDPNRFDAEKIEAVLRHGVLDLRLPKSEQAKRRQIPVSVH